MPQQVFGAAAAVSMLNRAFYNASPSNAIFNNQVQQVGTSQESQILFANEFAAGFADVPAQDLVERVLGNMGLLPNDGLVEAGVEALEAYGPEMYGAVVLSFAKLLATLETATGEQAAFNDAAKAWNKEVGQSYQYSSNPANTTDFEGDFGDGPAPSLTLTHGADNLVGTAGDDVFKAPVTQNGTGSGQLANTFETGDVIDGGAGTNSLVADLISTGTISNIPPISATTTNIQNVFLRAQRENFFNTIDAEKMAGVEQWWTDNSRADITIEDIRTDTANTTFGMRLTDPGVDYTAYFNALFLEGDMSATSAVTLNIYEGPAGAPDTVKQLQNITVREINFKVDGQTVTLSSDAIKAADTWAELEDAIVEALDAAGVESITVTNRGNGQFVFEDALARNFEVNAGDALVLAVANNVTVTNSLVVGREEVVGPVVSNAVLDGAGNGSQGGTLNLGAMSGLRGVEELNLSVDRDSHLQSITSFNQTPGQYNTLRNGEANEFLEVVNLSSMGAKGDLTVGRSTANQDGRVATWADADANGVVDAGVLPGNGNSGFVNLREFNGAGFEGDINIAVTLDNNVDSRYLKGATEAVNFQYTGGAQDDIFNIADVSTAGVSADTDFAMAVNMGAGDDRLILDVASVRAVKVDGGTGDNSIVVSNSHGTTAGNTFAEFKNFQTYEVEGTGALVRNDTTHNFASMAGVKNVVIATDDGPAVVGPPALPRGDNTTLINLEADQDVTISGKNQTTGTNSAVDQFFGNITLTNDAGADRTITLDNTARLSNATNGVRQNGVLTVDNLTINTNPATGVGATKNVTIESNGVRTTANVVNNFVGRDVESLTLTGTQALTLNVNQIANQAANTAPGTDTSTSVQINAAGLSGELNLAVNGAMLANFGTKAPAPAQIDTIVGATGGNDTLMFYDALGAGNAVRASAFESVQLGSFGGAGNAVDATGAVIVGGSNVTMYGDVAVTAEASGVLNTANLGVSKFEVANLNGTLTLAALADGAVVDLGDANRNESGDRVAGQVLQEQINLQSTALTAATTAGSVTVHRLGNINSGSVSNIAVGDAVAGATANTGGFRTINLVVDHAINQAADVSTVSNINLDVGSQARTLNVTGGTSPTNVGAKGAQLAAQEVQTLTFAGNANNAANDTITVAGVTVTLTNAASTGAQTADDVENDLNAAIAAAPAGSLLAGAVVANNGAGGLTVTYAAALGNVSDAALAVNWGAVDPGAQTTTLATTTQGALAIAAVTGQADVLDLTTGGNVLANSLEVIDLSGFRGQVTLTMEQALGAAQTDVNFVMSAYSADITLSTSAAGTIAGITHNSVFDFNGAGSVQVPAQWTIDNIVNGEAAGAGVNNNTLFDLRDLGIANYAQVEVLYVDDGDVTTDLNGYTLAAGSAVIRSESQGNNGTESWEIIVTAADGAALTGVGANGLTADNFIF